jgi:hypothetical protein
MSGWRTMETVPKDGQQVLLLGNLGTRMICWWSIDRWSYGGGNYWSEKIVTRWQPLPAPTDQEDR